VDDVRQTLTAIAQDLREGAVVIDTSFNKSAVAQWAQELMPEKTYFVGWTPALNPAYFEQTAEGIQAARADMFKSSPILITALPGAPTQAIRLAVDLATMIGAQPLFADTDEVDGLIALGHQLPQLVSVALANTALAQPGWREARKLAGQNFAEMPHPVTRGDEYKALGQSALLNQANVVRVLDEMIASLARLRNLVAENDQQGLQAAMDQAVNGRILWLKQRQEAKWATEDLPPSDTTSAGDVLGRLIGLGKKPGDTRKKK
jgi:prephenate dehydrogenase